MGKSSFKLKTEMIRKVTDIFNNKGWPLDPEPLTEDEGLFDRICTLLSKLNEDEQQLMLTLTQDFLKFNFENYHPLFAKAIHSINFDSLSDYETIYIIPLESPVDTFRGRVKSSSNAAYLLKSMLNNYIDKNHYKLTDVSSVYKLNHFHPDRYNSLIIFVDDFIGTGSTAYKLILNFFEMRSQDDYAIIISAASLEAGMYKIRTLGIDVYTGIILKKGIKDSPNITDKNKAYQIIDAIERRLAIDKKYHRGYKQSEALVKMIRTPNNTFPVYWCEKMKNGKKWPAPFPR